MSIELAETNYRFTLNASLETTGEKKYQYTVPGTSTQLVLTFEVHGKSSKNSGNVTQYIGRLTIALTSLDYIYGIITI